MKRVHLFLAIVALGSSVAMVEPVKACDQACNQPVAQASLSYAAAPVVQQQVLAFAQPVVTQQVFAFATPQVAVQTAIVRQRFVAARPVVVARPFAFAARPRLFAAAGVGGVQKQKQKIKTKQ